MAFRNPVILGRKICSACGRWRHITDFSLQKREPFRLQAQCRPCARETQKRWAQANPEKVAAHTARWRERNLETERTKSREYQRQRRAEDPEVVREQARAAWHRMRDDPERWAERLDKQRDYYHRRKQDPSWEQERRAQSRARYENGGREVARVKRAREKLRRHLAVYLVIVLRAELARREVLARAERQRMAVVKRAWAVERRRRWEAGEFDDLEPVVRYENGDMEVQRLPSAPLARWIEAQDESVEQLAKRAQMRERAIRRYLTGESVTVDLGIVDAFVTRLGVLMIDVYDPARYPVLYEVPEDRGQTPNLKQAGVAQFSSCV